MVLRWMGGGGGIVGVVGVGAGGGLVVIGEAVAVAIGVVAVEEAVAVEVVPFGVFVKFVGIEEAVAVAIEVGVVELAVAVDIAGALDVVGDAVAVGIVVAQTGGLVDGHGDGHGNAILVVNGIDVHGVVAERPEPVPGSLVPAVSGAREGEGDGG